MIATVRETVNRSLLIAPGEGIVFGVHVYSTYSEWLNSPARREGKQCQTCHMAPTGTLDNLAPGKGGLPRNPWTLGNHRFFAGSQAAMLRDCLKASVTLTHNRAGLRAEVEQRLASAKRQVVELRCSRNVFDGDRGMSPGDEIRHGEMSAALDRLEPGRLPLRRRDSADLTESDEASIDAERGSRLLHGDPKQLVDLELGSDPCRDPRDEPLALQCLRKRRAGPRAIEGQRSLRGDRLQEGELLARERARLRDRANDEDGDHPFLGNERNEGDTFRPGRLSQPGTDDLRGGSVVDGEGAGLEDCGAHSGGLVVEVDARLREPVECASVHAAEQPGGDAGLVVDDEHRSELHSGHLLSLIQESTGNGAGVARASEDGRDGDP